MTNRASGRAMSIIGHIYKLPFVSFFFEGEGGTAFDTCLSTLQICIYMFRFICICIFICRSADGFYLHFALDCSPLRHFSLQLLLSLHHFKIQDTQTTICNFQSYRTHRVISFLCRIEHEIASPLSSSSAPPTCHLRPHGSMFVVINRNNNNNNPVRLTLHWPLVPVYVNAHSQFMHACDSMDSVWVQLNLYVLN